VPEIVAIGASAGGLHAVSKILGDLMPDFPGALAIVQHRRADSSSLLRDLLAQRSAFPIVEPTHGTPIRRGHVYLAPPDYHLLVEPGFFSLSVDPPVSCSRPSIDVLFESVAASYRRRAICVVLTGASSDGAAGAARLDAMGGTVIVQDPATAEAATCPAAALASVPHAIVLPLGEIGRHLNRLCSPPARVSTPAL
jgi:two-component system chemotaxis response regulator CheB